MKARFYEGDLSRGELESVFVPMLDEFKVVVVNDSENLLHW